MVQYRWSPSWDCAVITREIVRILTRTSLTSIVYIKVVVSTSSWSSVVWLESLVYIRDDTSETYTATFVMT
jgi:hypothetical protein